MACEHKHTGSSSPGGVYLYVVCTDCNERLAESAAGKKLRESCPGFFPEHHGSGFCKHCHYDAFTHITAIESRQIAASADAAQL